MLGSSPHGSLALPSCTQLVSGPPQNSFLFILYFHVLNITSVINDWLSSRVTVSVLKLKKQYLNTGSVSGVRQRPAACTHIVSFHYIKIDIDSITFVPELYWRLYTMFFSHINYITLWVLAKNRIHHHCNSSVVAVYFGNYFWNSHTHKIHVSLIIEWLARGSDLNQPNPWRVIQ